MFDFLCYSSDVKFEQVELSAFHSSIMKSSLGF